MELLLVFWPCRSTPVPRSSPCPSAADQCHAYVGVAGDRFEWGRGKRFASVLAGEDPPHEEGRGRNRSDGGLAGEGATAMSSPYPRFHGDPDPPWAPGESEMGPEAMEDEEYASDFAQVWVLEARGEPGGHDRTPSSGIIDGG